MKKFKRALLPLLGIIISCSSIAAQETDDIPVPMTLGNKGKVIPPTKKNRVVPNRNGAQPNRRGRNGFGTNASNGNRLPGAAKKIKLKFAGVKDRPVLSMDSFGGFRAITPESFNETPVLEIYADGKIITGTKSPQLKVVEGKMDIVELKSLLAFIADECRFFDLSTESIRMDLKGNLDQKMMDAATTRITINLEEQSNSVDFYAIPQAGEKILEIESVASITAIANRCRQLVAMTRLGSYDDANAALKSVNAALLDKFPTQKQFSLKDLSFAEQFIDGRVTASFVRSLEDKDGNGLVYATWQMAGDGTVTADVNLLRR